MKAEETVWNSVLQKFYYRLEHDFNQYLEWELHTGLKNSIPQHNAISYLYLIFLKRFLGCIFFKQLAELNPVILVIFIFVIMVGCSMVCVQQYIWSWCPDVKCNDVKHNSLLSEVDRLLTCYLP